MKTQNALLKPIAYLALATAALLLLPLIAMQFSEEVAWTLSDFIFAGVLIFGTGLAYIFVTHRSKTMIFRIAVGFALFSGFFLIWSNLAVGLIGSEDNPLNLLYFLVIGVGVIGAFITRFKATGLMYTLFAMATTQFIIMITSFYTGMPAVPESSVYEIIAVNGFFITLFIVAAILFRYSTEVKNEEKFEVEV